MNDLPHSAISAAQRLNERILEQYEQKKRDKATQQRHDEMLKAQADLVESNNRVAEEVRGISDSLQEQIDQTQKELEATKIENKKLAKRSWIQFALTLGVSIVSVGISAVALYFSICK